MFYRLRRIRKLFQIRINREYLYSHDLHDLSFELNQIGAIRIINDSELQLLQNVWSINEDQLRRRFHRGDLCYCCFIGGAIASYHWVQYSGQHFLQQAGKYYDVKPNEGWIYHVRVAEWARGRGINSSVYQRILMEAKGLGKSKLWVYTNARNKANQKGLLECGFRMRNIIVSLKVGDRYFLLGSK